MAKETKVTEPQTVQTPTQPTEEKKEETKVTETEKKEEKPDVIGNISWREVHQQLKTVRMKRVTWPISKSKLPKDIQEWLTNKGYGTNIYLKPKEWLQSHKVDMEMVEKLKKFINDNYL